MNIGYRVYGLGALALGVVGIVWADFASVWQPVPEHVPHRETLAYLVAATEVLSGVALLWRRTAASGAIVLAILFAIGVALLQIPKVATNPLSAGPWGGVAEQSSLVAGGLLAFAMTAEIDGAAFYRVCWILFGLCCLVFGMEHFAFEKETAQMVPKYLPMGQVFWARLTGAAHIAAGLGILSGIRARLAAQMLTAMFLAFQVLVHAPVLLRDATTHFDWTINAINLTLAGAAWVVADSLRERTVWGLKELA
ncbi:MAG TPA: DoxX family membrane protein [Rhizomicrobium sp.]|nr:DoxX family membrane protein [Rhizomicrobium sp.]